MIIDVGSYFKTLWLSELDWLVIHRRKRDVCQARDRYDSVGLILTKL